MVSPLGQLLKDQIQEERSVPDGQLFEGVVGVAVGQEAAVGTGVMVGAALQPSGKRQEEQAANGQSALPEQTSPQAGVRVGVGVGLWTGTGVLVGVIPGGRVAVGMGMGVLVGVGRLVGVSVGVGVEPTGVTQPLTK